MLNDPSGHLDDCGLSDPNCYRGMTGTQIQIAQQTGCTSDGKCFENIFGVIFNGVDKIKDAVIEAIWDVGMQMSKTSGGSAWGAFRSAYGITSSTSSYITIKKVDSYEYQGQTYTSGAMADGRTILFASFYISTDYRSESLANALNRNNVVHELGHVFSQVNNTIPYDDISRTGLLQEGGFAESPDNGSMLWRMHPCSMDGGQCLAGEVFADSFLGWTYGYFGEDKLGIARERYMNSVMFDYLTVDSTWIVTTWSIPQ